MGLVTREFLLAFVDAAVTEWRELETPLPPVLLGASPFAGIYIIGMH